MNNSKREYRVGQIWNYKTRKREEASYLTILKIEEYPNVGTIIHIAVDNVNLKSKQSDKYYGHSIVHMPFSLTSLDNSVTQLQKSNAHLPDFREGYLEWQKHFNKGEAGIFSITVAEAVAFTERTLDQ